MSASGYLVLLPSDIFSIATGADRPSKRAKLGKNPHVDTHFLPDREREEIERQQREELRREWLQKQEDLKAEDIEITYSYWDGSGHRKVVTVSFAARARRRGIPVLLNLVGPSEVSQNKADEILAFLSRLQCKKGDSIAQFLEKCRWQFPELRAVSVDNLMYIKEDLIIPHVRCPD